MVVQVLEEKYSFGAAQFVSVFPPSVEVQGFLEGDLVLSGRLEQ